MPKDDYAAIIEATKNDIDHKTNAMQIDIEARVAEAQGAMESLINTSNIDMTQQLSQRSAHIERRLEQRLEEMDQSMKQLLTLELQIRSSSVEDSLRQHTQTVVVSNMETLQTQVVEALDKLLAHSDELAKESLREVLVAVTNKISAMEDRRGVLVTESISSMQRDIQSLKTSFDGPIENVKHEVETFHRQLEALKTQVGRALPQLSQNIADQREQLLNEMHNSEDRSKRKYDSMRQAIHVIAAAVNQPEPAGMTL